MWWRILADGLSEHCSGTSGAVALEHTEFWGKVLARGSARAGELGDSCWGSRWLAS